jgi:concentrative nucleoside transporter, CNT family
MPSDRNLRLTCAAIAVLLAVAAYAVQGIVDPRVQALAGIFCFIFIVAAFSTNLNAVSVRTLGWGIALQFLLALFILKFEIFGVRPGYAFFAGIAAVAKQFLAFTAAGSTFVFGDLARTEVLGKVLPNGFVFAFTALPTIVFISSFFTVLYYYGVLQRVVALMARAMMYLMRTSGAETLSVAANVFMGQTEAPLIVKPYVPRMTQSELLTMMVGGMAHISGGVMAVYIGLGADPVAILTTSVMAAPCSLYLSKLMLPELQEPETRGRVKMVIERQHVNVIDAAASGASDGMTLAINVAAMLIAFLAFIALFDYLLGLVPPAVLQPLHIEGRLTLARVFSVVFSPAAVLMGVPRADVGMLADLLGTKLVLNEFVAFVKLTSEYRTALSPRSYVLATYALTGFANFGSIGIQLGGIGGMAPTRRGDLARLGAKALFVGFLATLINASIASLFLAP